VRRGRALSWTSNICAVLSKGTYFINSGIVLDHEGVIRTLSTFVAEWRGHLISPECACPQIYWELALVSLLESGLGTLLSSYVWTTEVNNSVWAEFCFTCKQCQSWETRISGMLLQQPLGVHGHQGVGIVCAAGEGLPVKDVPESWLGSTLHCGNPSHACCWIVCSVDQDSFRCAVHIAVGLT
jgi:hypothetical protein